MYFFLLKNSFAEIENFWLSEVENYAEKDALLMLLGNKSDLIESKTVSTDKANVNNLKKIYFDDFIYLILISFS